MERSRRTYALLVGVVTLFLAGPVFAASPVWMPGFPMRMGTNVMLMWAPVPGATAYNVYRSNAAGDLGEKIVSGPMNNHMDMNVPLTQNAYYTVKAVLVGGAESDPSPAGLIAGVKPPDAPKWVGHMPHGGAGVAVRFDAVGNAAFYNVYRAMAKEGPFSLVGSIQDTKYVDPKIDFGKPYFYQVVAVDKNNAESPKSEVYELTLEKKIKRIAAQAVKLVEKLVTEKGAIYGPDERSLVNPTWLQADPDAQILYITDAKSFMAFGLDDSMIHEYLKPEDYTGSWGRLRGIGLGSDGNILTVWASGTGVRVISPEGAVVSEFDLAQPTAEEYAALGREEDWKKDKRFKPNPRDIAEDSEGRYWVTEPVFSQVHVYEPDGTLLTKIGPPRPHTFELKDMRSPSLIQFDPRTNRMYITDPTVQTIRAFDAATLDFIRDDQGQPIYGWKRSGGGTGSFQEPRGLALTAEGDLLITDGIDGRVQGFGLDMTYKYTLVTKPGEAKPAGLTTPMAIDWIGDTLYIAQPLSGRVVKFGF